MGTNYAVYKLMEASAKNDRAMAILEAELKSQETPLEAAKRRPREIIAAVVASLVAIPLMFWFNWFDNDPLRLMLVFRLMTIICVWCGLFALFGPPSRASVAMKEYHQQQAANEAARNNAVRQAKIARGL